MNTILIEKVTEVKKNKKKLQDKLKIKISFDKNIIKVEGDSLDEYEASIVFEAINSGFSAETSLRILEEDIVFEKINIKDYTRRKDLSVVKSRIIGKNGKTKETLEEITNCNIKIHDKYVSIIGEAESVNNAITAITNIIKGSKQSNAYKYLERINTKKRKTKE